MFVKETHILVVDDSLNIRRIVVDSLQRLGFTKITTAEDAVEALGKLKFFSKTPHAIGLVLSDLNMPGSEWTRLSQTDTFRKRFRYAALRSGHHRE